MTSIKIFGIKSCSTMSKAMKWLDENSIEYYFHDYKKQSIDETTLSQWLKQAPWDSLINKRGTTWRKLSDFDKQDIDNNKAIQLMIANTSLIKRPVLVIGEKIHLGFKPEQYQQIFK